MSCWEWMSEKSPHSVLSLILLNPTFFFCSLAPHNPHSWARPNLKHKGLTPPPLNTLTPLTFAGKSTHRALSQGAVTVLMNAEFFLIQMNDPSNRLITSFAFGGVKDFSYAPIPNLLVLTAGWSSSCFCIYLRRSEWQMWGEMFRLLP